MISWPQEMQGKMRKACGLAAEALVLACEAAKAGVTTDEAWLLPNTESFRKVLCSMAFLAVLAADFFHLACGKVDRRTGEFVIGRGAYPVGINYYGFPRGLCASPNEVALHGVPNTRPLEEGDCGIIWICQSEVVVSENVLHVSGDIVNFDVTVYLDGAFGDCSAMVCVGNIDENARFLVDATKQCLDEAVELVGPGEEPDTDSSGAIVCQDLSSFHSPASFHSMVCGNYCMVFDVAHSCVLFVILKGPVYGPKTVGYGSHHHTLPIAGLKLNQIGQFCYEFARKRDLHVTRPKICELQCKNEL